MPNYNVLIVDDSAVMRKIILKNLTLCNLSIKEIFEASSGEEGLKVLDKNSIDLLFVDLNMEKMTGDEMVKTLRNSPKNSHIPVIFISSDSESPRIKELLEAKTVVIHKPFTLEDFKAKLSILNN